MSLGEVLARDFTWEIDDGADTFVEIGGLTSVEPSGNMNEADTTTYDSEGWIERLAASRSLEISMEGQYQEDPTDGTRDSGQEQVEAAGEKVGTDSKVPFQVTTPGGTTITFEAIVNTQGFGLGTGGGNDDPAGWGATLMTSGKPTTAQEAR